VGLERLIKIAIVLYEHKDDIDQQDLESSLMTHNHLELLARLEKHQKLNFGKPHTGLLSLLSTFYKSYRYDRFTLSSVFDIKKERRTIFSWLESNLGVKFSDDTSIFGNPNDDRYRRFVRRTVLKVSKSIFDVIKDKARSLNLYTYELRHGSKAESVFLREVDISDEDVLWKELLLFFMNTRGSSGYLKFLREIEPLDFDPGLASDYLDCFKSNSKKALVMGELEHLYEESVQDVKERLELMQVIGSPNVFFDEDEDDEDIYDPWID